MATVTSSPAPAAGLHKPLLDSDRAELGARVLTGALFLSLTWRLGIDFVNTHRATDLLLVVGEALVVVFTVLRRPAIEVDRGVQARLVTVASMLSAFLARPGPVGGIFPEAACAAISAAGVAVTIGGKISLGGSFGLLPACRGLVDRGLYRMVRHPIYLGYLISHVGFLLSHPTIWNVVVFGIADAALVVRAGCEERVLVHDARYEEYRQVVRWRLVPGI